MKPVILITPPAGSVADPTERWQPYADAIRAAGGDPELLPRGSRECNLDRIGGLLLIGGGDLAENHYGRALTDAERRTLSGMDAALDGLERDLIQVARQRDLPTLGICRGMQVLNWALGGTQLPDIALDCPNALPHWQDDRFALAHRIDWRGDSRLGTLLADCQAVTSTHHQAVERVADVLRVSATAPDGIIEALEIPDARFCCGVQFHPERMTASVPAVRRLFAAFVEAARG